MEVSRNSGPRSGRLPTISGDCFLSQVLAIKLVTRKTKVGCDPQGRASCWPRHIQLQYQSKSGFSCDGRNAFPTFGLVI